MIAAVEATNVGADKLRRLAPSPSRTWPVGCELELVGRVHAYHSVAFVASFFATAIHFPVSG